MSLGFSVGEASSAKSLKYWSIFKSRIYYWFCWGCTCWWLCSDCESLSWKSFSNSISINVISTPIICFKIDNKTIPKILLRNSLSLQIALNQTIARLPTNLISLVIYSKEIILIFLLQSLCPAFFSSLRHLTKISKLLYSKCWKSLRK